MLTDLHMHTNCSDGVLSPQELADEAVANGLDVIAITDHDVVGAYEIALEHIVKNKLPLQLLPAVEINTNSVNREVHILGYHIDVHNKLLLDNLEQLQVARSQRIDKIIVKLQELGYDITLDEVVKTAKDAVSLGRPHVAGVMVDKGYFKTNKEVFDVLLAKGAKAYVPHVKLTIKEAVDLIRAIGGLPVLAHPGLLKDDSQVRSILQEFNLGGIEAYYPEHTPQQIQHYLQLAKEFKLLVSGGSDYHARKGRYPKSLGVYALDYQLTANVINWRS